MEPDKSIQVLFCAECGRNDRYRPMPTKGKHFHLGYLCDGKPVVLTYTLKTNGKAAPRA